jgi:hypothetical protein
VIGSPKSRVTFKPHKQEVDDTDMSSEAIIDPGEKFFEKYLFGAVIWGEVQSWRGFPRV